MKAQGTLQFSYRISKRLCLELLKHLQKKRFSEYWSVSFLMKVYFHRWLISWHRINLSGIFMTLFTETYVIVKSISANRKFPVMTQAIKIYWGIRSNILAWIVTGFSANWAFELIASVFVINQLKLSKPLGKLHSRAYLHNDVPRLWKRHVNTKGIIDHAK